MKGTIFLLLMLSAIACRHIVIKRRNDLLWDEYKKSFNKNYSLYEERLRRLAWEKSLADMLQHNLGYHSGNHSYSMGLNQFSDLINHLTDEDFQKIATGLKEELKCNKKNLLYSPPDDVSIPDSVNWTEKGYVTPVQNQGSCGACWAFCSVAALEGQLKRMTGKLVKLSEQQLIDCSIITGNKKCEAGQMCRAYEYAVNVGGVVNERYYPYVDEGGECKFSPNHIASNITGYLEIAYGDEQALLMAVALIGPVAAGLDGYRKGFRNYKSGIYDDPTCSNTTLNHALTIVGYGTENGKDYWLVKNSWGTEWGENGFAKMVRNKNNQCGLASNALFPVLRENSKGEPVLSGPRAGRS